MRAEANYIGGMGLFESRRGPYHDQVSSAVPTEKQADQADFIQECHTHTTSSSIQQSTISVHHPLNLQLNSVVEEHNSREQTYIEVFISTFQRIVRK